MQRTIRTQPGQALILFALMLVVLVGMIGVALDGGNVFVQRRTASITADAAALAATRAFLEAQRQGASASTINAATYSAAASYIASRMGTTDVSYTVAYYLNNGDPTNRYYQLTGLNDASSISTEKTNQELTVRGVEVEIRYTFRTFFMQVFQFNTSTVKAKGLGYFGYLGSAVGQDVVPLALDMSAGNQLRNGGEFRIKLFNDFPVLPAPAVQPSYDIYPFLTTMLQFTPNANVSPTPGCYGSSGSLDYDWCAGSPTSLEIGSLMNYSNYPYPSALRAYVQQRIVGDQNIVLLPEYFIPPGASQASISSFVAVELVRIDRDALVVRYMPYFYTSGSISGNGSGIPGAYAINLVR